MRDCQAVGPSLERKIHMMNRHERRRTRKARENTFHTGYVKQTVPGSDTPAAREWDLRLKRIRADSLALCKRLLPGITWSDDKYEWLGQWYADAAPPPKSWSRWTRPRVMSRLMTLSQSCAIKNR